MIYAVSMKRKSRDKSKSRSKRYLVDVDDAMPETEDFDDTDWDFDDDPDWDISDDYDDDF